MPKAIFLTSANLYCSQVALRNAVQFIYSLNTYLVCVCKPHVSLTTNEKSVIYI